MNWNWDELEEKKQKNANTVIKNGDSGSSWQGSDFRMGNNMNDFFKKSKPLFYIVCLGVFLLWLLSGFYIVHPDELGVETLFGAYVSTTEPGPHYHFPYPIGAVYRPKVTEVKRVEIGFNQSSADGEMLTEDENIVNVQFSVQYQIKDPVQYIFKVSNQTELIQNASQAVMREVIGSSKIDSALTDGKQAIQTKAQDLLQGITDEYELGVQIIAVQMQNVFPPKEVSEAFKDVASAREDKARFINEAEAYRNEIIPKARGEADAIVNRALAYKEALILKANAEAKQFELLLTEYKKAPAIIRERLYIETMEEVLTKTKEKTILPNKTASNILPYLPLSSKGEK
ncbi:MAG: FtsH protease activity modulator HflK [Desulfovibrionaceae bacterium]|nr:FtsH protease activity modulator HflK [Desulfovibrionaceae bacterium]